MKKLVVVLGSARQDSVSEKAAMEFIKGAEEAGYKSVIFRANDMNTVSYTHLTLPTN